MGGRLKYAIVRAHGLKTHLVPEETLKSWAFITDDEALFSELAKTEYGPFFAGPEDLRRASKIEEAHARVMARRARQVTSLVTGGVAEFFKAYMAKYDLENVRRIIYSLVRATPLEEEAFLPIQGFVLDVPVLAKANSVEQLVNLIRVEEVKTPLKRWLKENRDNLVALDITLDAVYYDLVVSRVRSAKPLRKDGAFREILKIYLDRFLLVSALKALLKEERPSIKMFEGRLDATAYKIVQSAEDLRDALVSLGRVERYRHMATEVLESYEKVGQPWILELAAYRDTSVWALRYGAKRPLSPAFLLTYLIEVEWEAVRIKTLLLSRIVGLTGDRVYDLVREK